MRSPGPRACVLGALLAAGGTAAADPGGGAEDAPPLAPHTTPILPTFNLDASPSGSAKFSLGADYTIARAIDQDLGLSVVYRTATNSGVTNLFTLDTTPGKSKLPKDWQLGASATISILRPFIGVTAANTVSTHDALRRCLRDCDGKNKEFCAKAKAALLASDGRTRSDADLAKLDDAELLPIERMFAQPSASYCADGKDLLKQRASEQRDRSAVLPTALLSAGLLVGSTHYDYLHIDPADSTHLTAASADDPSFSAVTTLAYVSPDLLTIELNGRLQTKRIAPARTAKWCVPVGAVGLGGQATAPAEVCDERSLGDPVRQSTADISIYVGAVSRTAAFRASAGFFYSRQPPDGSGARRSYGARFPILLATDILPGTGVYKGMLRITPTVSFAEVGTTLDSQLLVMVEVFTSRSLFGTALDAF